MGKYIWSPSVSGFFPLSEKALFEDSGLWPQDGIEVSAQEHEALFPVPEGMYIDSVKGKVKWVTLPPLTPVELQAEAESKRNMLIQQARDKISLWQTELQLGIISDDDKASLIAWMKYIQALNAVDTSTAPDIEWPVKPE